AGVWRSDDGGRSWREAGLRGERIRSLAAAHGRVYAGTKPARIWATSGGERWEPLTPFPRLRSWFWWSPAERPHTAYVQTLAVSPTDPDVLLAGIEAGALLRSADGGRTWSGHSRRASRDPHVVTFHAGDPTWAYEGGGTGPAVSSDGGVSWRKRTSGLAHRYCWGVAADPADPTCWYVAAADGPRRAHGSGHAGAVVLRADAPGWTTVADELPAMPYLLAAPAPGTVVAVLGSGELRLSHDGGGHWETPAVELGPTRTALLVA
ncbi:MAG: WD40/YVTN/BNR-like repeat-containing protein, partial [Pseudomonadota bacterium]